MTRGKKVLLGCLALPFILIATVMLLVGISFVLPKHEPEIVQREVEHSLGSALGDVAADSGGFVFEPQQGETPTASRVAIDVEEGSFEIVPGEPGGALRIDARFDEKMYDLVAEPQGDDLDLRFKRKGGPFRLFTHVRTGGDLEENVVRIHLPIDSPVELKLRMRRGEARVDLTDVPVRDLDLDVAMGSTRVRFDEPNPVALERLHARSRMGELRLVGIGHAGPRAIDVSGTMGDVRLDFAGTLPDDASARLKLRMGEMVVRVPDTITTRIAERRVSMGDLHADHLAYGAPEGFGPTLELTCDVRMGQISVR